jgi:phosphoserine phosphatase
MNQYYDHVIFDLDSTLCRIEGVDELARWNQCQKQVEQITIKAMAGKLEFKEALELRLKTIRPQRRDLMRLRRRYAETLTRGAQETIEELTRQGTRVQVISGGYWQALPTVAHKLGLANNQIVAIELWFDEQGNYVDFDRDNELCEPKGKAKVVAKLRHQFPGQSFAMIGDGMSDYETAEIVDRFICFAGVVKRPAVVSKSQWVVTSEDLRTVLPLLMVN